MKHKIIFLAGILVLTFTSVHAKEKTYIREYTYQASDLDSKVSARNNTLKLIKASVLEEVISYVHNNQTIEQQQQGDTFKSSFIQKTTTSSAGFVRAKILEEHWSGFEMRIKAEVKADPERILRELERSLSMKPNVQPHVAVKDKPLRQPIPNPVTLPKQTPQKVQVEVEVKIPDVTVQLKSPEIPESVTPTHPARQAPQTTPQYVFVQPGIGANMSTPNYGGYQKAAQLSQVVMLMAPIKIRMTEYKMNYGDWPEKLEEIRIDPEDTSDGQYINQIRLGKEGRLVAELSNRFGRNKKLSLFPKEIMGGIQTRWICETNIDMESLPTMALSCNTAKFP